MIYIGVCDEQREVADSIATIIVNYMDGNERYLLRTYYSETELLSRGQSPDIVFLGIMFRENSGIDVAQKLISEYPDIKIIFIASDERFLLSAFQIHAFQYILKPISELEISSVLEECLMHVRKIYKGKSFCVQTIKGLIRMKAGSIFYVEYKERKLHIVTATEVLFKTGTVNKFYESVKGYGFGRPHNSYIVNYDNIYDIKGYEIIMNNGEVIPIAQRRAINFKTAFQTYLCEEFIYV